MLKIKPIIVGLITTAAVFVLLLLGECIITDKMEKMNENVISGFAYTFLLLSVFTGAFVSAMTAKGRGLIYGGILALIIAVVMIILCFLLGGTDMGLTLMRALGCLPAGVIGGAVGIYISNKNEYI